MCERATVRDTESALGIMFGVSIILLNSRTVHSNLGVGRYAPREDQDVDFPRRQRLKTKSQGFKRGPTYSDPTARTTHAKEASPCARCISGLDGKVAGLTGGAPSFTLGLGERLGVFTTIMSLREGDCRLASTDISGIAIGSKVTSGEARRFAAHRFAILVAGSSTFMTPSP